MIGCAGLEQSHHWHAQDLYLGVGLVGELRDCLSCIVVPSGEPESWSGGGGHCIGWTGFQHPLAWVRIGS